MENIYYNMMNNLILGKYQGNFELFYNQNNNLNAFLINSNSQTTLSHFPITNEQYNKLIEKLKQKYEKQTNTNIQQEPQEYQPVQDKPKVKTKKPNNKISGFVDALIIAFITGSFIGIILLNIYSKIAQHM